MLTIVLYKDLECTIVYVRCDSGYDGYHETHLIVTVCSKLVPIRLGRQNEDKAARALDLHLRCEVPCFIGREHCDVLSMQMDSDLVIYRTTLVRTFQVSTGCVLGKWVYLVTLAMSLFDLQDVCIVIGSLATLDLPMVVDLIGIYVLKGPYCTLTMTNWFLQALSVIHRGSWGDVARRFTMIRWASGVKNCFHIIISTAVPPPPPRRRDRTCSDRRVEEIPFVPNSSGLLVQADEGVTFPVVDMIKEDLPPPTYNQDLGLIHSTNGNHLESPNEGSSIDHQVTIYLHAQNITMFPTNETWGSADKKGERGSRGPQQPAATQITGSVVTPSFEKRVQMAQNCFVQTVLNADAANGESQEAAERDKEKERKEARSLKRRRKD
ncbi:pentatricopeptide repeat-containing protein mitochondrial-like [Dorcoceras hygrometricum]|uniref:Pentatricopeptide repeat-containing protein mitochondrial-like n=1 Tax=Dorcoceras hygrometricum TaxID=472368 RepID=A0A2Z7CEP4_9LAMI|nr:pentatricopeptide repeat-containing protein mitochondrial-like [Dorcoceras hygrometricum]